MKTVTLQLFEFCELSEAARKKAADHIRDFEVDFPWWEWTYEDANTVAKLMGIRIATIPERLVGGGFLEKPDIMFSLYGQGGGATFTGFWRPVAGCVEDVRAYAPQDTELHEIAAMFERAHARTHPLSLQAEVTRNDSRYCHQYSVDIEVFVGDEPADQSVNMLVSSALQRFMLWIHSRLIDDYEDATSDESLAELAALKRTR